MDLSWSARGIGFGHLVFYRENGQWTCHDEHMGRDFAMAALAHWLDSVAFESEAKI